MTRTLPPSRLALGLALLLAAAAPRAARAADPAPASAAPPAATATSAAPATSGGQGFGAAGQWAFTIQSLGAGKQSPSIFFQKVSGGGWNLAVEPSIDYFLASGVSLGALLGFVYDSASFTTLAVGPRAGFNQSLSESWSFWPTVGVAFAYTQGNGSSSTSTEVQVFAPFLYHPVPHFFLGLGPFYDGLVQGSGSYADYGLNFTLGGWL
ncbi:MAG TPA: hypothetical protein VHG72_07950 [Polyangia bacterium]|nr:hypothetical protein [Polyangia bacterium]